MKILSLRVAQFRKFDQAVLVDGFADGLNLVAGPNETGKSTLLLALRAALFERHGTKSDAVKALAPHHVTGARPTIALDFEIGGERYRLEKSFLKRPAASLETASGRRFEGSEAEAALKRLLRLNPSERTPISKAIPAHFGVLLTPQTRSFHQPDLADVTRHSLEAAIAADIAELGNQSEVDGLLAEFEDRLYDFVDKRGKPKGDYEDVTMELATIEQEIAEAKGERDALHDELEKLAHATAERTDLIAADNGEKLTDRLTFLETARTEAAQRQALENNRLAAGQQLQAAKAKRAAWQAKREKRQHIIDEIDAADKAAEDAMSRHGTIEAALSDHEARLAELNGILKTAKKRRNDLETLGRNFERRSQIDATLSALATEVRLDLEDAALDQVSLNGDPLASTSDVREVTEGLAIEIAGIGRISIEPKIEPMRDALSAKAKVEKEIAALLAALDLEDTARDIFEDAWQAIAADIQTLEAACAECETASAEERRLAAETNAILDASADRKARFSQQLAEIDAAGEAEDQAALGAEIADAKAALDAAEDALQTTPLGQGRDAASLDAEITNLRAKIDARRRALEEANKRVVRLEAAIAVRSGHGLDEKIDHLERQRHRRAEERDAFALDHEALSLLQSTLRDAAAEAKATFNAPLSARLAPYIQDLFPGVTPLVTPDFSIRAIDRSGVEEPFLHLSDGTREQIAILARLAYADMLQEQGLPALIVLDDALAFSDDQRFQRMIDILRKAAERIQIIILSCREERFDSVDATRLKIEPAAEVASSAA